MNNPYKKKGMLIIYDIRCIRRPSLLYLGLWITCYNSNTSYAITYDILFSLQEMCGDKSRSSRQTTLRTIMNTKMMKGTLVRDYMIYMIILFNEMELFRVEINKETKVNMIIETLSTSFK